MLARGMVIEAGTLARPYYETGFWLAYLRDHPVAAIRHFEIDGIYAAIGRHEGYLKLYADTPERIASVNAALTKLRASKNKSTVTKLGMEALTKAGDCGDFYTFYRVLCGTSAHASVRSTDYYLEVFPDKTLCHEFGPDLDGIPQQAAFNCHAMLLCSLSLANITEADAASVLHDLTAEFDEHSRPCPSGRSTDDQVISPGSDNERRECRRRFVRTDTGRCQPACIGSSSSTSYPTRSCPAR